MTRSSEKGKALERKVANILTEGIGQPFIRVPHSGMRKTIPESGDVYSDNFPYCIECKKRSIITIEDLCNAEVKRWWNQSKRQAQEVKKVPLLVVARDRGNLFVILPFFSWYRMTRLEKDIPDIVCYFNIGQDKVVLTTLPQFIRTYNNGHQKTDT